MSDCKVAKSRFSRMSTLESAMVLAMFWLLLMYSSERWSFTVRTARMEVDKPISPNTAMMPNRVFWKSLLIFTRSLSLGSPIWAARPAWSSLAPVQTPRENRDCQSSNRTNRPSSTTV